jgi:DNA-binding LacI/PurR family transcriptional regulator
MVAATVDLLHEQMSGERQARQVMLPCRLVERASVRAAARA